MNMLIISKQRKQQFFLKNVKKKLLYRKTHRRLLSRKSKNLEMVSLETEQRIAEALAEHQAGIGTILATDEDIDNYFDALNKKLCIN